MRHYFKNNLTFAVIFALTLIFQNVYFHYLAFHNVLVSSILTDPLAFWDFYLPTLSICVCVASISLFISNRIWAFVISSLISVWLFANLIYFRANGIFLDPYSITMIGNMNGFWSSVTAFVHPMGWWLFLAPLVILCYMAFNSCKGNISVKMGFLGIIIAFSLNVCSSLSHRELLLRHDATAKTKLYLNPFSERAIIFFWGYWNNVNYVKTTSPMHSFIYNSYSSIRDFFYSTESELSVEELNKLKELTIPSNEFIEPNCPLFLILFESLENWAINDISTPNIFTFIESHNNILWAKNIKRQTRGGTSADGQMILNTGLLPVTEGATCFRYSSNVFPSLSELYEKNAIIFPGDLGTWCQGNMNNAYSIDTAFVNGICEDLITFGILDSVYGKYQYIMSLSIASHTPFIGSSATCPGVFKKEMPEDMRNYLNCVHYTDFCLESFLSKIDSDEYLRNSTIVITGDHTIFDKYSRDIFKEYCDEYGETYSVEEEYCPLIIY